MGIVVSHGNCFPLVSGTASFLFIPCRGTALSAVPGALQGPSGNGSWLLSARNFHLVLVFLLPEGTGYSDVTLLV